MTYDPSRLATAEEIVNGSSPFELVDTALGKMERWRAEALIIGTTSGILYRVPEIVTRGRFPDGGESDSTWRTQEARHVGSDTIAPGF